MNLIDSLLLLLFFLKKVQLNELNSEPSCGVNRIPILQESEIICCTLSTSGQDVIQNLFHGESSPDFTLTSHHVDEEMLLSQLYFMRTFIFPSLHRCDGHIIIILSSLFYCFVVLLL